MELNRYAEPNLDTQTALVPAWGDYLAKLISGVSTPPLVATAGIIMSAKSVEGSIWLWVLVYLVISVLLPTVYVLWLLRSGRVTSFHLNIREQRKLPLVVILSGAVLSCLVLFAGGAPTLLVVLAASGVIQVLLMFVLTLRWKVSGHSATASGLSVLALMLFGREAVLITLLIPVVAWSRVRLRRHSLSQTAVGAVLGGLIIAVALLLHQHWMAVLQIASRF